MKLLNKAVSVEKRLCRQCGTELQPEEGTVCAGCLEQRRESSEY